MPFLDVFCGMGAVSRAAQDLSKAAQAARTGQACSPNDVHGYQVTAATFRHPTFVLPCTKSAVPTDLLKMSPMIICNSFVDHIST